MNVNPIQNAGGQVPAARQPRKRSTETSFQEEVKKQSLSSTPAAKKERPAALTNSEKQYFEQLFPNAADEIRTYNPYERDGATTSVRLGTLFDKKG
jgi:hypothetical protein